VGACLLAALWVGDRTENEEEGGGQDGDDGPESADGHEDGLGDDDHRELEHA
jgi:hypothetical protein